MFDFIFTFVDNVVLGNVRIFALAFMNVLKPLLGACVGLYAVLLCYKALFDAQNLMIMESINFLVKLALITTIALTSDFYIDRLVPILYNIGDDISVSILGGGGSTNSLQTIFDNLLDRIVQISADAELDFFDGDSWIAFILTYQLIIVTIIGALPFIAVTFAYLLVAKVMMGFLLILGPLFIMMAFFPSTRSFFQAWSGQCFNYALLTIIYPIAFTMFTSILTFTVFSQPISLASCYMALVMFIALLLISVQIPTFCSSLSGGVGINGLVGNVARTLGGAATGMKSLGMGGGGLPKNPFKSSIKAG